jgi:phosphoribosyl-dephospho-CoA transferase
MMAETSNEFTIVQLALQTERSTIQELVVLGLLSLEMKIQTNVICMLEDNFPLRCLGDIDTLAITSSCIRYVRKDILYGSRSNRRVQTVSK